MPSNISALKATIKKRVKSGKVQGAVQQVTASRAIINLAKFTNVDDGILSGGWTVLLNASQKVPTLISGQDRKGLPINKSRRASLKNLDLIDKINGKSEVVLGNNIFYGKFVNSGTRTIRPFRFVQRAAQTTKAEMQALGIKVEVSNG